MPEQPSEIDQETVTFGEWGFLAIWTALTAVGYIYGIGSRSLWLDEVMSLRVGQASISEMWSFFQGLPEQHPLYYVLLAPWLELGTTEFAVRSFSAVFGLAGGWATYFLARRLFGIRVAVIAASLMLVSPFWLHYAQEARMYTLLGFLAITSHLLYLKWRAGVGWAPWTYVIVGILGAYTHLFFLFLPVAHLVVSIWEYRSLTEEVRNQAAAVAAIAVAYMPWATVILTNMPEGQGWKGIEHLIFALPYTLFRFSAGYSVIVPVAGWKQDLTALLTDHWFVLTAVLVTFGSLLLVGAAAALRKGRNGRFVLLNLAVPVLGMYLLSAITVVVGERYLVVVFPLFIVILGLGIDRLVFRGVGIRRLVGSALAAATLLASVNSLYGHYSNEVSSKASWREAASWVGQNARTGDRVIFHEDFADGPFEYYYQRLDAPVLRDGRIRGSRSDVVDSGRMWVVVSHAPAGSECAERLNEVARSARTVVSRHRHFPSGAGIDLFLVEGDSSLSSGIVSSVRDSLGKLCPP